MKVNVTQKDIDDAVRGNSGHCMISDSIKRQHPNCKFVSTDLATIRYTRKGGTAARDESLRHTHLTPLKIQQALLDFDKGKKVKPFSFTLGKADIVTPAGTPASQVKRTAAKKKAAVKAATAAKRSGAKLTPAQKTRAALASKKPSLVATGKGNKHVAQRVGGTTPPIGALRGTTRRFGLRNVH